MTQRQLFDGETFVEQRDGQRIAGSLERTYSLMRNGEWHTLSYIAAHVGCTEAGASARLRDLRKAKFRERYPNRAVQRRNVGGGLWEYRLEI